ncbi:MAG: metallophosphoesterase family protein [Bacteroidota bacterium]|nr:metallophosphoesterase family protein [Bacteroidota bacterium]
MKKIGLLSDTHSILHPKVFDFFSKCDEIWHAGDLGDIAVADQIREKWPLRAVYGNIDGRDVRMEFPEILVFTVENVKVLMTHIGGYPGKYDHRAMRNILQYSPQLFICGHSHILRVMYDKKHGFLCINPGAAGNYGAQLSITMVRFIIDGSNIRDLDVLDIPRGTGY